MVGNLGEKTVVAKVVWLDVLKVVRWVVSKDMIEVGLSVDCWDVELVECLVYVMAAKLVELRGFR